MKQYLITVAAGKRLIAKAVVALPKIQSALSDHTIVIISGSTNGYIAEELLGQIDQNNDFSKSSFLRGANVAPGEKKTMGTYSDSDVVLVKGEWIKGKTVFDVASSLGSHDIILKGANAVDADRKTAGIQIGNPTFGTCSAILPAVYGRRVELILPVGLEKRVFGQIPDIAARVNDPASTGLRMVPVSGTIITELEAIQLLSGAHAELVAAGGISGALGGYWLGVTGTDEQMAAADTLLRSVDHEPAFA